jgi:pimeloyl-ACP methyl ester carboxylesterase
MATIRSRDGTRIAFDAAGTGSPLVLVDGAFGSRVFGPMPQLAPHLAKDFTVFTYDRRGRNESGDTPPYAVAREVEDLAALIDTAGGSAFVYGISSGATLALEAAAAGLPITKLALYEPPYTASGGPRKAVDAVKTLEEVISSGRRGDAVEFFMTRIIGMPAEGVAPLRQSPYWPAMEAVAHTLIYDVIIMGDNTVPVRRLAAITVPTLVMNGENTSLPLARAAHAVTNALLHARHLVLEGQTHDVAPQVIAPILRDFFTGTVPR